MAEIRARDDLVLTVNRLMICAMEDIDSGRNEASPTTLDLVQRIEDCDAALRLALDTATRERDDIAAWAESWMKRVAAAERERDEARRHAEEQLADVLRLRFLGIEFASQYGDRALACKYDNSCDDSGREPECIPCAFRRALGLMGVN